MRAFFGAQGSGWNGWLVGLLGAVAVLSALGRGVQAESSKSEPVPLFAAIEAGDVEVKVIPQRAERVTLQVTNKVDRPLELKVPAALAAAPVLAQMPVFPGANNQNNQNANSPQAVGFPGMNNGQNNNVNAGPGFPMNPGFFNVPAGKTIKVKLPAACLEFGKPTPNSRIAYELKPIEEVAERPEVAQVLSMIGRKEVTRRIGQLAIWNLANGTEWTELAKLQMDRIGGIDLPQYSSQEILAAQELVKQVTAPAGKSSGGELSRVEGRSLSRR